MRNKLFFALFLGTVATAVIAAGPGRFNGDPHGKGPGGGPHGCPADTDGDGAVTAAEWDAHFAELDTDGDGTLTGAELPGMRHRQMPAGAFAGFIAREADADGDGTVTASEYEARIEALDADGDGALSVDELHARRPAHAPAGLPPFLSEHDADGDGKLGVAELQVLFAAADADGNGSLAGDELAPMFHHRGRHR